jgi:mannosyltransferase OCH1-like enzyme
MNKATKRDRFLLVVFFIFLVGLYIYRTKQVQEQVLIDKFVPRTTSGPKEVSGVPLVIYRTWISNNVPIRMKKSLTRSLAFTPEFDNHLFTDDDCYNFIRDNFEPNVLNAYKCLKPGAYKADLWRYCILYKKGGVYIDIKHELKMPLYDVVEKHPVIYVQDVLSFPRKRLPLVSYLVIYPPDLNPLTTKTPLYNGFLASPPGNPVFKACIDEIVESCKNRDYKQNMLDITGPYQLGRIVDKYEGESFARNSPFKNKIAAMLHYYNTTFMVDYLGYRDDQSRLALSKVSHYSILYKNGDVYDTSVKFNLQ